MPPSPAQFVERQIMGNGQEPRADTTLPTIVSAGVPPPLEHGLLQKFLGDLAIPDDAQDHRQRNPGVTIVEIFERGGFTGGESGQQDVVVVVLMHAFPNSRPQRALASVHPDWYSSRVTHDLFRRGSSC